MSRRRPIVYVVDGDPIASARSWLPGYEVTDPPALIEAPFDLATGATVVAMVIDSADAARRAVLAATRGITVVAKITLTAHAHLELLDDLSRVADVRLATSSAWEQLTDDQRRIIAALAAGWTVEIAAGQLGWSRRTATRRLGEAKRALGVASTAEAVRAMPAEV